MAHTVKLSKPGNLVLVPNLGMRSRTMACTVLQYSLCSTTRGWHCVIFHWLEPGADPDQTFSMRSQRLRLEVLMKSNRAFPGRSAPGHMGASARPVMRSKRYALRRYSWGLSTRIQDLKVSTYAVRHSCIRYREIRYRLLAAQQPSTKRPCYHLGTQFLLYSQSLFTIHSKIVRRTNAWFPNLGAA